jgi:dTDP-4-amino-4,6-dideoxygalactose transaminase
MQSTAGQRPGELGMLWVNMICVHIFILVHLQPCNRVLGFAQGQFPEVDVFASTATSLPLFPRQTESIRVRVITALGESALEQSLL